MEASASSQMQVTVLSCPCEAEIPPANGVSGGISCANDILQMFCGFSGVRLRRIKTLSHRLHSFIIQNVNTGLFNNVSTI